MNENASFIINTKFSHENSEDVDTYNSSPMNKKRIWEENSSDSLNDKFEEENIEIPTKRFVGRIKSKENLSFSNLAAGLQMNSSFNANLNTINSFSLLPQQNYRFRSIYNLDDEAEKQAIENYQNQNKPQNFGLNKHGDSLPSFAELPEKKKAELYSAGVKLGLSGSPSKYSEESLFFSGFKDFEKLQNYRFYFPHNNPDVVVSYFTEKWKFGVLRSKKKKRSKNDLDPIQFNEKRPSSNLVLKGIIDHHNQHKFFKKIAQKKSVFLLNKEGEGDRIFSISDNQSRTSQILKSNLNIDPKSSKK